MIKTLRILFLYGIFLASTLPLLAATNCKNKEISLSSFDKKTAQMIRKELQNEPSLSKYAKRTHVSVTRGKVTLSGSATCEDEKMKVEALVKLVPGVKSVTNQLKVYSH